MTTTHVFNRETKKGSNDIVITLTFCHKVKNIEQNIDKENCLLENRAKNKKTTIILSKKTYLFKNFNKKSEHLQRQMRIGVPEILDDALGPLEAFLAECFPRVQRHHCAEIF